MHQFPINPSVSAKSVQFVRRSHHDFKDPSSRHAHTLLCSAYFDESFWERKLSLVYGAAELEMRVH